jgi:hypothetical protein
MDFHSKYLKYKNKYLDLKKKIELNGGDIEGFLDYVNGPSGRHGYSYVVLSEEQVKAREEKMQALAEERRKKEDQLKLINKNPDLKKYIRSIIQEKYYNILKEKISVNHSIIEILTNLLTFNLKDESKVKLLSTYSLLNKKNEPDNTKINELINRIENCGEMIKANKKVNEDDNKLPLQTLFDRINNKISIGDKQLYYDNFVSIFNEYKNDKENYLDELLKSYLTANRKKYPLPKPKFFM